MPTFSGSVMCCPPPTGFSIWLLCVELAETGHGCWSDVLHCPPLPSCCVIRHPLASRLVVPPIACLIFWLLCIGWWVSPLEIDTTSDKFLSLAPVPSIFFYSVTKAFFRYNLTFRHEIVPKNCTVFLLWQNGPKMRARNTSALECVCNLTSGWLDLAHNVPIEAPGSASSHPRCCC